ncbi:DUF3336 domain-containing protein [Pyruvatibacter sp.]|uniref:DUF3336 domain-containing protein n=1 Tax=Pyruvatibacter sp. TaxID=1981328 RepID=UPI0032EF2764
MFNGLKKLEDAIAMADSYAEWSQAAMDHDAKTGMDRWKRMDQSRLYDHVEIRSRLDRLRELRARHDNVGLLFALNEGIHGNMGGMGKPMLYKRAKFGTKKLICDYVDEIASAIEHLAALDTDEISFEEKVDFFRRASHCYGRTALMLSGGGILGNYHMGVVKALIEHDLLPTVVSGSSAGSIVAAVLGSNSDEQLARLVADPALALEARREAKWFDRALWGKHAQLDIHEVEEMIARLIPDLTFQEAFEKTGRHINVSIAPAEMHQTSRLLNAITSPNVYVRKAVLASSAVPGVFPPVMLEAKTVRGDRQPYLPTRKWVDGSVHDDLPAKRLMRLYGVNHFIVSMVNPLVIPWIRDPKTDTGIVALITQQAGKLAKELVRSGVSMTQMFTRDMPRVNFVLSMFSSVATQTYTGDINIIPTARIFDPRKLLSQPTQDEIMSFVEEGERATWPKIEMIRVCTKISRTLDRILVEYDALEIELAANAAGSTAERSARSSSRGRMTRTAPRSPRGKKSAPASGSSSASSKARRKMSAT